MDARGNNAPFRSLLLFHTKAPRHANKFGIKQMSARASRLGQFRLIRNRCRRLLLSPFLPFVSHGGNNGDFPPLSSNPIYNVRSAAAVAVGPIAEQKRGRWDDGVERPAAAKVRMLFAMLMMMTPMSVMIPHISEYGNERAEWRMRRKSIC